MNQLIPKTGTLWPLEHARLYSTCCKFATLIKWLLGDRYETITIGTQARGRCKLCHIHDLDSKLLPAASMDASPNNAEGSPGNKHDKFELNTDVL